jgi:HK97 family phage prohead protease
MTTLEILIAGTIEHDEQIADWQVRLAALEPVSDADVAEWQPWGGFKPFPNEHSARLVDPGMFKRFRRQNDKFGPGIHAIFGVRKADNKVTLQAIRFDKAKHTTAQAKKWLKDHGYKPISFEPAGEASVELHEGHGPLFKRAFPFDQTDINPNGAFNGYASVFGVQDAYDEIVMPGAFENTLAKYKQLGRMPKLLWQHRGDSPIGNWPEMHEDGRGLAVTGQLALDDNPQHEVRQAREAHTLMQMRPPGLDGLSIGYKIVRREEDTEKHVTKLLELDLWEVSLVTFPANDAARVGEVKSVRDLEGVLRDAGLSRREAKTIASIGWATLEHRDDDSTELDEIARRIEELSTQFRGEE